MWVMVLGLILFLGVHSVRIVAEDWRTATLARVGEKPWKGLYSLVSAVGFVLIIWGFAMARRAPVLVWAPPMWTHHLAALLTLVAFVLIAAAYVPGNGLKARLHDPMILGVKTWALAHLLANGFLHDIVLFGAFLVWAVFDFRAARRRRTSGVRAPAGAARSAASRTAITVVAGLVAWAVFALWLHRWLIGVQPFP